MPGILTLASAWLQAGPRPQLPTPESGLESVIVSFVNVAQPRIAEEESLSEYCLR